MLARPGAEIAGGPSEEVAQDVSDHAKGRGDPQRDGATVVGRLSATDSDVGEVEAPLASEIGREVEAPDQKTMALRCPGCLVAKADQPFGEDLIERHVGLADAGRIL